MKPNFSSPRINVMGKKSGGIRVGKITRVPDKTCHQVDF